MPAEKPGGSPMRINSVSLKEFTDLLNTCAGKIMLGTKEGDRLVANGLLAAAIGLASFFKVAQTQEISIECEIPEEQQRIERFLAVRQSGV